MVKNMEKLSTENYYVAYLDFLGMKKKIVNDEKDKHLNNLKNIYQKAVEDKQYAIKILGKKIFIKIFSDNIVIAVKCSSNDSKNKEIIKNIINLCGLIQINSLKYGYLIRGAIVEDKFCKDDMFIYGKALVKAVYIEENTAIYPRIIIDKSLFNTIDSNSKFIKKDSDSYFYINSFYYFCNDCYKNFKEDILKQLKENKEKEKQKIRWFINRYNEYFEMKHKIGQAKNTELITEEEIS